MNKCIAAFCLVLMLTMILLPVCAFASGSVNVYELPEPVLGSSGGRVYSPAKHPPVNYYDHYFVGGARLEVPAKTSTFYPAVSLGVATQNYAQIDIASNPPVTIHKKNTLEYYPGEWTYSYQYGDGNNGHGYDFTTSNKYRYFYQIYGIPSVVKGYYKFGLNDGLG